MIEAREAMQTETLDADYYKRQLEAVCNNATLAFFIMDEHQQCSYMNPAAEALTGFSLSEVKGRALHDVIHHTRPDGRHYPLSECPIDQAFPQNNREQGEEVFVHKDGSFYSVAYTASPIRDASGIVGTIIEVRDITQEKLDQQARQDLDRARTAFFSNISHEFRTPLTLILSPLEDLLADPSRLTAQDRSQLQMIQRNGQRLLKLVNTLLDFSRIEAGRMQPIYQPTDLSTFTTELASVFRSTIERAGITLEVDCPASLELVYVDREMWEKIIFNLITNAFKSTFVGSISVRLESVDSAIKLSVEDTGIGIPAHELPRLFERFHRVEGARGRSDEGTGIGLSLVQEFVNLHGGAIEVSSVLDRGSCFTVQIPTGTAHLPPTQVQESCSTVKNDFEGLKLKVEFESNSIETPQIQPLMADLPSQKPRILLADDNADMRDYVKRLLAPSYDVITVADGASVLATVSEQSPDLILSDVMMPKLSGFALLRQLRADPRTQEVPVILLSARAGEASRVEGLAAGADDYLIKPFSARELLARIEGTLKLAQLRREAQTEVEELAFALALDRQRLQLEIADRQQAEAERNQAELERERLLALEQSARLEAERANRVKDDFLAVLSHELRTPLNPILGWSRLLQTGRLSATKTAEALATIERNAKLQTQLIEDLLDVSRILQGKLTIAANLIDLTFVITAARETVRLAADAKRIQIQIVIDPEVGSVSGDAGRLQQVVWNLLSNAVKFTPEGGQIEVWLTQIEGHAQLQVKDTGKGIRSEVLPYVFDYFRQADSATTRQFGGLGLGLAIARQIVELHGGTIAADSPGEDQGAVFTVRLPIATRSLVAPIPEDVSQESPDLTGLQILLVDDEADSLEFAIFVLQQAGATVTAVTSATAALQVIPQLNPDVLISDIGMPEMDGYSLLGELRAMRDRATLESSFAMPVSIALTAYAGEYDQQQALKAGFSQHLPKPIDPEMLINAVFSLNQKIQRHS